MKSLLIFLLFPVFYGFNFSPMTSTLNLESEGDKIQFQIDNNSEKPIPVVLRVVSRIQNEDGTEKLPQTSDFQLVPPQVIVPPKDKRTVRLKYKGSKNFGIEKSYRVIAEQFPLNLEEKKTSGIQMLLKYQAALFVTSKPVKAKVSLVGFEILGKKLLINFNNSGTSHRYFQNIEIIFTKGKKEIILNEKELKPILGQNILAKSKRKFVVQLPKGLQKDFKGKIKFNE